MSRVTVKHGHFLPPLHYLEEDFCADVLVEAYYLIVMYGSADIPPAETDTVVHSNLSGNNALNGASN